MPWKDKDKHRKHIRDKRASLTETQKVAARKKEAARQKARLDANPELRKRRTFLNRLYLYGLNEKLYADLMEAQGGLCALCKEPLGEKTPHIDHNHATGEVRGLLHNNCNIAIGLLDESPNKLRLAADYLESF
jgi:hypothetical protein